MGADFDIACHRSDKNADSGLELSRKSITIVQLLARMGLRTLSNRHTINSDEF